MASHRAVTVPLSLLLVFAVVSPAQQVVGQEVTIPAGVPLRVALDHKVRIKQIGDAIHGRLAEPVYVYDQLVLPAGAALEGHIAQIGSVPAKRRVQAFFSGNFTPDRDVRAQWDKVVLQDETRIPLTRI